MSGAISIDAANFTGYQLESLNLSGNQLSGEIPPELGNYEVLEFLDLSGNQLGGEIPSHLGDLASLTSLDLSDNQLSGEVPSELADRAASMEKLNLRGNESNGSKLEFGSDVGEYLAAVLRFTAGCGARHLGRVRGLFPGLDRAYGATAGAESASGLRPGNYRGDEVDGGLLEGEGPGRDDRLG